jgi:hypothetical protein
VLGQVWRVRIHFILQIVWLDTVHLIVILRLWKTLWMIMMQYPWLTLTGESMFSSYEEATIAVMERVDTTWCFRPHTMKLVLGFSFTNRFCFPSMNRMHLRVTSLLHFHQEIHSYTNESPGWFSLDEWCHNITCESFWWR